MPSDLPMELRNMEENHHNINFNNQTVKPVSKFKPASEFDRPMTSSDENVQDSGNQSEYSGKHTEYSDKHSEYSDKPQKYSGKLDADIVKKALEITGGNKAKAARYLKVGRATLYRFLERFPESADIEAYLH
ncbi:MAG: helix-turn-helix domain-containing protein [Desulfamplus sp.]|nr:helix-turn-helix domain-containing protein [Desulfamplus sp.]